MSLLSNKGKRIKCEQFLMSYKPIIEFMNCMNFLNFEQSPCLSNESVGRVCFARFVNGASGLSKVVAAIPAEPSGATSNACEAINFPTTQALHPGAFKFYFPLGLPEGTEKNLNRHTFLKVFFRTRTSCCCLRTTVQEIEKPAASLCHFIQDSGVSIRVLVMFSWACKSNRLVTDNKRHL